MGRGVGRRSRVGWVGQIKVGQIGGVRVGQIGANRKGWSRGVWVEVE